MTIRPGACERRSWYAQTNPGVRRSGTDDPPVAGGVTSRFGSSWSLSITRTESSAAWALHVFGKISPRSGVWRSPSTCKGLELAGGWLKRAGDWPAEPRSKPRPLNELDRVFRALGGYHQIIEKSELPQAVWSDAFVSVVSELPGNRTDSFGRVRGNGSDVASRLAAAEFTWLLERID